MKREGGTATGNSKRVLRIKCPGCSCVLLVDAGEDRETRELMVGCGMCFAEFDATIAPPGYLVMTGATKTMITLKGK